MLTAWGYRCRVGTDEIVGTDAVSMAFLFTDMVGSTALWERFPVEMPDALRRHDALLEDAVRGHGGEVVHHAGDGIIASFPSVAPAAAAAVAAQEALLQADWAQVGQLGVRMGVHCGPVVMRDGSPYGWALNFGARFSDIGAAGQILISEAAVEALGEARAADWRIEPIGTVHLRDIAGSVTVHQLTVPELPHRFPSLRDAGTPDPLPVPPDEFVGRAADLALLERALTSNRLLTLVGPPGVGTSRLGAELVNRVLARFPDGAVRVDVVTATGSAAQAVSNALGVRTTGDRSPTEALAESLRARRMVLFIDRGEQLDDDLPGVVESVLRRTPSVTVVCAGRSPLGLAGEIVHRVDPLSTQVAIDLVRNRAPAARSGGDEATLREIAHELDGLPLALEVVAAASDLYSWDEILDALRRTDPASSGSPARAIAVPIAVGLEDLPAPLRSMLVAATSFDGPFDRRTFGAVCAPDVDEAVAAEGLGQLVDRSLIVREPATDLPMFRMLRPVRDVIERYVPALERRAAEQRLERWASRFVAEAADGLRGRDERVWNQRISSQFGNLRVAYVRSVERGDIATAAVLATTLWDFGFMRFHPEYLSWSRQLVERFPHAPPDVIAPVHGVAALGDWIGDDLAGVVSHAGRALALEAEHDLDFDLPARLALISATVYSGLESGPPERVYAESVEYQRNRPEAYFRVNVETQNSVMSRWLGDHESAVRRALRAIKMARQAENPSSIAFGLWALGGALADDDPLSAETHLGTALELARDAGNRWIAALTQMSLVSIRHRTAGALAAAPILLGLLDLLAGGGHRTHLWSSLRLAGAVLGDLGDEELSVQLAAWVRTVGLSMPAFPSEQVLVETVQQRIRAHRGDEWIGRTERLSSAWTPETATALARVAVARHLESA